MNNIKIYCLKHPETQEIRYIGKTKNKLSIRLSQHISNIFKEKNHRAFWIKSLLEKNLKPLIELIEECNETNWTEREIYWIKYFKELGYNLVNTTIGGENASPNMSLIVKKLWENPAYRLKHSGENHHMKKIKNKLKITGENNGMFGKKHSKETLKKMSIANQNKTSSLVTRKKISNALSNVPKSPIHKKHISEANRKLSDLQINEIFIERKNGLTLIKIAEKFNVSYATISRILNKKGGKYQTIFKIKKL